PSEPPPATPSEGGVIPCPSVGWSSFSLSTLPPRVRSGRSGGRAYLSADEVASPPSPPPPPLPEGEDEEKIQASCSAVSSASFSRSSKTSSLLAMPLETASRSPSYLSNISSTFVSTPATSLESTPADGSSAGLPNFGFFASSPA